MYLVVLLYCKYIYFSDNIKRWQTKAKKMPDDVMEKSGPLLTFYI